LNLWPNGLEPGLPDGIFLNQKSQFGLIFESLAMEGVGKRHGHFVYFTANSYILRPILVYILWSLGTYFRFGMFGPSKIWQPWS
jgi:hypothetical protein